MLVSSVYSEIFSKDTSRKSLKLLYARSFCNLNNKCAMKLLFLGRTLICTEIMNAIRENGLSVSFR